VTNEKGRMLKSRVTHMEYEQKITLNRTNAHIMKKLNYFIDKLGRERSICYSEEGV
jgi:hypothetical protein